MLIDKILLTNLRIATRLLAWRTSRMQRTLRRANRYYDRTPEERDALDRKEAVAIWAKVLKQTAAKADAIPPPVQ